METSNSRPARRRLYVIPEVQKELIVRTVLHWLLFMAVLLITLLVSSTWDSQTTSSLAQTVWSKFIPAFVVGLMLLPIFIFDQLRLSNRMFGPIYRFRREMKKLSRGEGVQKLRFRDHDHWLCLAEDFNRLAATVIHARRVVRNIDAKNVDLKPYAALQGDKTRLN